MNTSEFQPSAHFSFAFLAMFLLAGAPALSQTPVIVRLYSSTSAEGVVTMHAGIDPMGVSGQVRFSLYRNSPYSDIYRTTMQAVPADSGTVLEFSDVFDLSGPSGEFDFWATVFTDLDTVVSQHQHSTFDEVVATPDVGSVVVDSIGTAAMKISAACNPRGQAVTFRFAWSTQQLAYFSYSDPFTLPPIDHDTVLSWDIGGLVPAHPYYLTASAVSIDRPAVMGASPKMVEVFTLYDSTAMGLTVPMVLTGILEATTYYSHGVNFGVHTHATPCYDFGLGENLVPPAPPAPLLDVRFVDPTWAPGCFVDGSYSDLRRFTDSNQVDTFYLRLLNAWGNVPIVVSWTDLNGLYEGPVVLRSLIDSVDMLATTHYNLVHPAITMLTITAAGPRPRHHTPNLLLAKMGAIGETNAYMEGSINPNGLPTVAWFEWGQTDAYGAQTPQEPMGTGFTAVNLSAQVSGLASGVVYHYRIVAANSSDTLRGPDQVFTTTAVTGVGEGQGGPAVYRLYQNYPNPFNPSTEVRYSIPSRVHVTLVVYDALGREVASLVDEAQPPGEHTARWDAAGLPGGAYFCRIVTSDGFSRVVPMLLLR